ncbi:hypothetical protein HDU79_005305 [Rhizoclosmatium sp. JEL0117]|nr:hypothetical protein HDU79_005305 [Rhizoclosmatium sp. JEL0117]
MSHSSTSPASIETLPPEVLGQIITHLPISKQLVEVGLASKTAFAPWIFNDVLFATTHIKFWLVLNQATLKNVPDLLCTQVDEDDGDEEYFSDEGMADIQYGLKTFRPPAWDYMPLAYKAGFYNLAFTAATEELTDSKQPKTFYAIANFPIMKNLVLSHKMALMVVQKLVSMKNFSLQGNRILSWSCHFGHLDAVKAVLTKPDLVVDKDSGSDAMKHAITCGQKHILTFLLSDHRLFYPSCLIDAAACGYLGMVNALLEDNRVDPSLYENRAVRLACSYGHTAIVKRLLEDPRVDATAKNCSALLIATRNQYWSVIDLLLKVPGMDPTVENNLLLCVACAEGKLDIVEQLLKNSNVNPASENNQALIVACNRGHTQIVKKLLAVEGVDPTGGGNAAVEQAVMYGQTEVSSLLLKYPNVRATASVNALNFALDDFASMGDSVLVQEILNMSENVDPDIYPTFSNACLKGQANIVQILLDDGRVCTTKMNFLDEVNHTILKILLQHKKTVVPNYIVQRSFQKACLEQKWDFAGLHVLNHNLRLTGLEDKRVFCNSDNVSQYLCARLKEAAINEDVLTIESILEHPRLDRNDEQLPRSFFNISNLLYPAKWEQAGLHLLHHNLRLSDNIDKMVFSPGSNIGEYLSFQLKEACKYFDDLSVESILTHPLWDHKQDEVIDTVLPYIAQLKKKDNSLILSVLKHHRYTQCKTVVEGTFHAQVVRFAHAILFPTFSSNSFENDNELLRWAIDNNLDAFVNLLVEDDRIGDISGDDHYVLSTAAANCRFGETFESLCRHNAKWIREHKIVSENQNDDNWRIFCTIVEEGFDSFLEHVPRLLKWAVEGNLTLVLEIIGFKSGIEVDLAYSDNEPLAIATNKHWCPMVEMLLKNEKVDPLSRNYSGIRKSVEYGCAVCVRSFIERSEVDASFEENFCLKTAARLGHQKVVDLLITHGRLTGMVDGYQFVYESAKNEGYTDIAAIGEALCL